MYFYIDTIYPCQSMSQHGVSFCKVPNFTPGNTANDVGYTGTVWIIAGLLMRNFQPFK